MKTHYIYNDEKDIEERHFHCDICHRLVEESYLYHKSWGLKKNIQLCPVCERLYRKIIAKSTIYNRIFKLTHFTVARIIELIKREFKWYYQKKILFNYGHKLLKKG